jgi:hypothetical protein
MKYMITDLCEEVHLSTGHKARIYYANPTHGGSTKQIAIVGKQHHAGDIVRVRTTGFITPGILYAKEIQR